MQIAVLLRMQKAEDYLLRNIIFRLFLCLLLVILIMLIPVAINKIVQNIHLGLFALE